MSDHLHLSESVRVLSESDGGITRDADGNVDTVLIHVIRPCIGKGKGEHLYEAEMLEKNAGVFAGWRMYVDHLSTEARKAAGGLPRTVRDLGGRVIESWWDPSVPADPEAGFDQGAVVGKVRPVRFIRELIDDDPELLEASISASATGVRPVTRNGRKVWLVEGIAPRGSVDWVTEAGAGGRVAPIVENAYATEEAMELALLEAMTDDELLARLRDERPHLAEALAKPAADEADGNPEGGESPANQGDHVSDITPEALAEALKASPEAQAFVSGLVESAVAEERAIVRAEARAEAQREVRLARMEVAAHKQIAEAELPEPFAKELLARYSLDESGEPADGLNQFDELDDEGQVQRTAEQRLAEAVEDDIKRQREMLAAAHPTRIRENGGPAADSATTGGAPIASAKQTGWGKLLESAGVDPDDAFAIKGAGEEA